MPCVMMLIADASPTRPMATFTSACLNAPCALVGVANAASPLLVRLDEANRNGGMMQYL